MLDGRGGDGCLDGREGMVVLMDEEGMVVLMDEEGMVSVNCFAFFSKDDPRRCRRSHVGLAFDLESLSVDLDCKSAFSVCLSGSIACL